MNSNIFICNRTVSGVILSEILGTEGQSDDILQGAIFITIALLFAEIQDLSWALYYNFVIKENHGFNKLTLGLFFGDKVK